MEGIQWLIQNFPDVGAPTLRQCDAPTYDFPKFSQNCMKLKEFGPWRGSFGSRPNWPNDSLDVASCQTDLWNPRFAAVHASFKWCNLDYNKRCITNNLIFDKFHFQLAESSQPRKQRAPICYLDNSLPLYTKHHIRKCTSKLSILKRVVLSTLQRTYSNFPKFWPNYMSLIKAAVYRNWSLSVMVS